MDECKPVTVGKSFGMIVMFFGVMVIALPITVIGSNFAGIYNAQQAALEAGPCTRPLFSST